MSVSFALLAALMTSRLVLSPVIAKNIATPAT